MQHFEWEDAIIATPTKRTASAVIPTMHNRDAPAAIAWICCAFGFQRQLVVPDDPGGIAQRSSASASA
jgi:hypothetical protein